MEVNELELSGRHVQLLESNCKGGWWVVGSLQLHLYEFSGKYLVMGLDLVVANVGWSGDV